MQTLHKQRGLSPITWILILAVIVFLALLAMSAVPLAKNYFTFDSVVTEKLVNDTSMENADKEKITRVLNQNLDFNDIEFEITKDNVIFTKRRDGGYRLKFNYVQVREFMWKYSIMLTYDREINVGMAGAKESTIE